jgi:hypothetical protein
MKDIASDAVSVAMAAFFSHQDVVIASNKELPIFCKETFNGLTRGQFFFI